MLYADHLVLMNEAIKVFGNKLGKWKETCQSKGLKVNFGKMVNEGFADDDMSMSSPVVPVISEGEDQLNSLC